MKRIIIYTFSILLAVMTLSSCEDFFDRNPADAISAPAYFSNEKELKMYTDGLIVSYLPSFTSVAIGSDAYTDLCATKSSTDMYKPGIYNADKSSGWAAGNFSFIRQVNYMLTNMTKCKGTVDEATYNHYEGVARFWRAYAHFLKVETFGNAVWIDHVISETDSLMYQPRQDREYVMHNVITDLQFAADNCSSDAKYVTSGRTYVNKWVATAMLSKIALYEASYRKYHKVNPSTNVAWNNKYETSEQLYQIAADAASKIMQSGVFSLHESGKPATDYSELFLSENIPTDEVIWSRQANSEMTVFHDVTWYYNSATYGQKYSPSKELVDMYLTTAGTPITDDKVTPDKEFEGRDYRLIQTVLGPGHEYKNLAGTDTLKGPDFSCVLTGYAFIKWCQEDAVNYSSTRCTNSVPILRYGEVLLNYAEAMDELGKMTEDVWNSSIGLLRARAGVTSIYPGNSNYVEDPYLKNYYAEDSDGAVTLSNTNLEIRRERATELCMEWASRSRDLMRWNMGNLIAKRYNNQGWRGIYLTAAEVKSGFTINGYTYTIGKSTNATSYAVANSGADATWSLSNGDSGYLIYNYKLEWDNKMYTDPIPTSTLTLSPQLGQNYGWN